MQTTLLGFAIALILALLAALIGPYFVNWNDHRAFFEAKASQLVGLRVHVVGDIDASILPFPSVVLRGIAIGPEGRESRLRARSLRIELSLGALMRGEVRAVEMRLVKPDFDLGLDRQGRIDWPPVTLATETLSIERLSIEDGRARLSDAGSRTELVLEQLWFNGEVRSLRGPFRGKGEFVSGGGAYGYSVSAGRLGSDGIRLKVSLETAERPLTVEADGLLAFEDGSPRYEGALVLARPAGSVLASGQAVAQEPWRLSSKVKVVAQSALLDEILFQYGPEERATSLAGSGTFRFGERPLLEAVLSARQIDFDRLLATPEAPRRLPLAALRAFGDLVGGTLRPNWPANVSIRSDVATLGGAALHGLAARLRCDGKDWFLDHLQLRAPGSTQVSLQGRLYPVGAGLGFTGDAVVDAGDPKTLVAWLAGRPGAGGLIKPWHARGVVTLGADRIAVERLQTEIDRGAIEGRVSYRWSAGNRPARLDAELKAVELDLDAAFGFGETAFSGLGLERPREAALAVEIGVARIAGFEAQNVTARLMFDAGGVAIERLFVGDIGHASIEAEGRIHDESHAGDRITIDLDARRLDGVVALVGRIVPDLAEPLRRLARHQPSARLRAIVSRERDSAGAVTGRLDVTGRLGAIRVNVLANATGSPEQITVTNPRALAETDLRMGAQLDADSAAVLLELIGLGRVAIDDPRPARVVVSASGPITEALRFDGKLSAGPIEASGSGALHWSADRPAEIRIDRFAGSIGGHKVQGHVALRFAETPQIDGTIEAEMLDAPATLAALVGIPARRVEDAAHVAWSTEPFATDWPDMAGRIDIAAKRARIARGLAAENLRSVARFTRSEIVFEDIRADMGRGRLEGRLQLRGEATGLSARLQVGLSDADAGGLFGADVPQPIAGRLTLHAEAAGTGRSLAAFVGSLSGRGRVMLDQGRLGGLNPDVFETIVRATELGMPTDGQRLHTFATGVLDSGALPVEHAEASIGITGGMVHLPTAVVQAPAAELSATATLDLATGAVDALLTLTGRRTLANGARPEIRMALRGTLAAPQRHIDTAPLATWLALRAVEQQAEQLDAIERSTPQPPAAAPPAGPSAPDQVAPAEPAPPLPPALHVPPAPDPAALTPGGPFRSPALIGAQN